MNEAVVKDPLQQWQDTSSYWTTHQQTIRSMFAPLTRELSEQAGIVAGQSILDVAGGAGEPSLTIAETVGPEGSVMCTDLVADMVAAAEREARSRGLENVQFRVCSADSLPFADSSFDATVSRLGVMFFPDPRKALQEMLRVTKPGGRVALAAWGKSDSNPYSYVVTDVLERHLPTAPLAADAPDAFRFAEPGKLAQVLREAGANDVTESVFKFELAAPLTLAEFWTFRSEISDSLREKLKPLATERQDQIRREVLEGASQYFLDGSMKFPAQMVVVTGTKVRGNL